MREVSAIGSVMRKIRSRKEKKSPVEGSLAGRLPPRGAGSNFFRKFKHKACGQVRLQGAPGGEQCNPFATRSWYLPCGILHHGNTRSDVGVPGNGLARRAQTACSGSDRPC